MEILNVNSTNFVEYNTESLLQKDSILLGKYRNFLQNRYPPCRKNTEILLKKGTHLAEKVQKKTKTAHV